MTKHMLLSSLLLFPVGRGAAQSRSCPGAVSLEDFRLVVEGPKGSSAIPLARINLLQAGARLRFEPGSPSSERKTDARIGIILVPAAGKQSAELKVLEPLPAQKAAEWLMPFDGSTIGIVFGPQGLDVKKVNSLVTGNQQLIAQLADYAQQTTEVGALVESQLAATPRMGPVAGVAALGSPARLRAWLEPLGAEAVVEALSERAPRARYWATVATPGVTCLTCHQDGRVAPGRHVHDPTRATCLLCAQGCVLAPGKRGKCRARVNVGGEVRSLVYGRPITTQVDPIEKKPFYHFLGSRTYSLATTGCPLRCRFCQNWEISQASPEDYDVPYVAPATIVEAAAGKRAPIKQSVFSCKLFSTDSYCHNSTPGLIHR